MIEEETQAEEKIKDDFKETLLAAIAKMSPKKFEAFSRALLNRMGVEFTEKAFKSAMTEESPVSEPEINQFLGAMNKYQADYGVFITNGRFTNAARVDAREGLPITLIDGNDLVRLVTRYELYITPVKTYVLDEFYSAEE